MALLVVVTMGTAVVCNLQGGGPDPQVAGVYALVTVGHLDRRRLVVGRSGPKKGRPMTFVVCVDARLSIAH